MTRAGRAKTLLTAVVAGVVVAHLWLTSALAERMRLAPPPEGMQRMQAQYVSQITLSAPPAAAPSPPAKPERRAASPSAAPPQPAASGCGLRGRDMMWSWRRGEGIETCQVGKAPGAVNNTLR